MSEYTEEMEIEFGVLYWRAIQEAKSRYWTMKNGEKIHVTKMSDSHIKNCIEMLERNESPFAEPFITMFKKEQERRANEEVAHQYHERRKEVLKEMSMPVGRNVMDALKKRKSMS